MTESDSSISTSTKAMQPRTRDSHRGREKPPGRIIFMGNPSNPPIFIPFSRAIYGFISTWKLLVFARKQRQNRL